MSNNQFGFSAHFTGAPMLVVGGPGLGGVASSCVRSLSNGLQSETVAAINPDSHFDFEEIQVKNGLIFQGDLPKLVFQRVKLASSSEMILFIPDTQALDKPMDLARSVIRLAMSKFGIETVVSFAATSGMLEPEDEPVVRFGTTDYHLGEGLATSGIPPLRSDRLVGLNGLMMIAAQELGVKGVCLVSEIPVWGLHTPNPKTTRALLKSFCSLMSIRLNFDHLDGQISALEERMVSFRDSFSKKDDNVWNEIEDFSSGFVSSTDSSDGMAEVTAKEIEEVEQFFNRAKFDRSQTPLLKAELDRLGIFQQYEDRFLDLFRDLS